jgi:Putative FMN-binding domain
MSGVYLTRTICPPIRGDMRDNLPLIALLAGSMEGIYKAMYVPKVFQVSDSAVLDAFITYNSFARLVSTLDGTLFATHLPLLLDRTQSSPGVLLGHVPRANSHWRAFDGQQEALAIFHGPHA